jgi:hypothetical protein
MKSMIVFAMVLATAACATAPGEPEATEGTQANPQEKSTLPTIKTEGWDASLKLADQENLLWPPGVSSIQVLYRSGPPLQLATTSGVPEVVPTYLAFDVADGKVIHVIMVAVGSSPGSNLKSVLNTVIAEHTNQPADTDNKGGSVGGGVHGTPPAPTPIIDNFNEFDISSTWQQEAIDAANTINASYETFAAHVENE